MNDAGRRRMDRKRAGKYLTPTETMNSFLATLARAPWVLRQITKLTAYVSTLLTPLLAKSELVINGETVDVFTTNQEAAITAGVVALLSGALEVLLSYAAAKFGGEKVTIMRPRDLDL